MVILTFIFIHNIKFIRKKFWQKNDYRQTQTLTYICIKNIIVTLNFSYQITVPLGPNLASADH